jgi:NAD-dependent dihydropyrimidine dehydrogenase PreA subunit
LGKQGGKGVRAGLLQPWRQSWGAGVKRETGYKTSLLAIKKRRSAMFNVMVDPDKCIGDDEECVEVCPVDVYKIQDGKAVPVNADECLGCESCLDACEYEAITISED